MAERTTPAARLGVELKAARTLAGMSQRALEDATDRVVWQVQVSRAELGKMLLSRVQVDAWLDATHAKPDVRERALTWLGVAHNETLPWPEMLPAELAHLQGVAGDRESTATLVRNFQVNWVPGLLQTAAYARTLLEQVDLTGRLDPIAGAQERMERQRVLWEDGRRFEFLICEHVLAFEPGHGTGAAQRDRIVALSSLPSVEIAILPDRRVGAAAWNSFTLYAEPSDDRDQPYVTTELVHGGQRVSDPDRVAEYAALWGRLWSASLTGDEALALVGRW